MGDGNESPLGLHPLPHCGVERPHLQLPHEGRRVVGPENAEGDVLGSGDAVKQQLVAPLTPPVLMATRAREVVRHS